ncbi:MAG: hypothetical protein GX552_19735 [Chloroflexi bacterium]|nr:hypothetical protein [Chloroflexota bacterium]
MFEDPQGPIARFSWGRFVIQGGEQARSDDALSGASQDIRLIGNQVTAWEERRGHRLNPSLITGVYDQDVEVLIIGTGVFGRLKCPDAVKQAIQEHGIETVIIQRTPDACRTYNALYRQGLRVALLAHGTC